MHYGATGSEDTMPAATGRTYLPVPAETAGEFLPVFDEKDARSPSRSTRSARAVSRRRPCARTSSCGDSTSAPARLRRPPGGQHAERGEGSRLGTVLCTGDTTCTVYAIDPARGRELWRRTRTLPAYGRGAGVVALNAYRRGE
ncbi:hypothetical protein QQY66_36685 [Streptomyces sp. DG2A-72]|uniref:hypothetical protein n=1 Tax=Streptomyces sp. DG2A-72 TaxID=3051386 RepID=UPI00265B9735|nr:hypothetical protein [Streptomyces sp. DG2A-72]MDO0936985.1 hypothetical protein [Streptomyces sp. DG2A-72]